MVDEEIIYSKFVAVHDVVYPEAEKFLVECVSVSISAFAECVGEFLSFYCVVSVGYGYVVEVAAEEDGIL